MKLPRDLSGRELVKALGEVGYEVTRKKGSHIRLTTQENGEHHITVPDHDEIQIGTLSAVLGDVSEHLGITKDELATRLFAK